ncbi:MAG: septal ring lytic transglycosylase RlpA family protein [Balneolaceae bacterium]|nr:septal ring lytic transglycosylase RlpA family protein [Balneolaceae bacterium]
MRLSLPLAVTVILLLFLASCGIVRQASESQPETSGTEDGMVLEEGVASWYGSKFHGRATANGETYNMNAFTAAHRTLPFNTVVRVENLDTGKEVVVRINDRGPYVGNRVIDLSRRAAQEVDMEDAGTANVRLILVEEGDRPITDSNRSSRESFTVQLASYNSEREAQSFSNNIDGSRVESVTSAGVTVYRVYYGTFETSDEAREVQQRLASQGIDGFVKQMEN